MDFESLSPKHLQEKDKVFRTNAVILHNKVPCTKVRVTYRGAGKVEINLLSKVGRVYGKLPTNYVEVSSEM